MNSNIIKRQLKILQELTKQESNGFFGDRRYQELISLSHQLQAADNKTVFTLNTIKNLIISALIRKSKLSSSNSLTF
ncbi:hypothetical protein PPBDW_I20584 [Photobacterium kishitanii]|nr:hypothetical protein PPBDW_I20584 [Photobacterium kishitanii]